MSRSSSLRFLYAVTVPVTAAAFLVGHLARLRRDGHDVHLASSGDPPEVLRDVGRRADVTLHETPFAREIALREDMRALTHVYRTLRRVRPHITNVGTPKAGLIGGLAATFARVPVRVYTLHGLRLETTRGPKRALLWSMERLSVACAHRVVCVSRSLQERAEELRVLPKGKGAVLRSGTVDGIDLARFEAPDAARTEVLRRDLALPTDAPVVGFVGRLTRDKGVPELLDAFARVRETRPDARLLLVGGEEDGDPLPLGAKQALDAPGVVRTGWVPSADPYYPLMRVLALPTYREGLPITPLEGAAAGLPVVTTRATGARDAVVHGETGLLVDVGDVAGLADALTALLNDASFAARLGAAGRERIRTEFSPDALQAAWLAFYDELWRQRRHVRFDRVKRLIDVTVAASGLVVLSPVLLILAALVRVKLGSPVLFTQVRPGLHGRPFRMIKFRTMTNATGPDGELLPDSVRLTRFGRLLRSTSLDELPELLNVVRGDMSLVGPRPLLMEYLPRYNAEQARRHEVRPGVTGLAQVSGRNALGWEDRFRLDVRYVDERSLALDLDVLRRTLLKVVRREDVEFQQPEGDTRFQGTPEGA